MSSRCLWNRRHEGRRPHISAREGGYVGHETNAGYPRPKNKNMLLEVGRPAGRPYILLCRGLLRFARLGASALRAEASARGAMTTALYHR
jgi:hypothetical protein